MVLGLTLIWIVLTETLDPIFVGVGFITSTLAFYFSKKYLPLQEIKGVKFSKLITYPFFLVAQIYLGAWDVLKIILVGERIDVVTVKTDLKNENLIAILGDTITLVPGSIMIKTEENVITGLWLRKKSAADINQLANLKEDYIGPIEKKLIKSEEK